MAGDEKLLEMHDERRKEAVKMFAAGPLLLSDAMITALAYNDQIQARYILSTSLMKRIVDFKKKTNRRIYLSFVGSMVFVAGSQGKIATEPAESFKVLALPE